MYVCMCKYVYIYIERKKKRRKERWKGERGDRQKRGEGGRAEGLH